MSINFDVTRPVCEIKQYPRQAHTMKHVCGPTKRACVSVRSAMPDKLTRSVGQTYTQLMEPFRDANRAPRQRAITTFGRVDESDG